MRGDDRSWQDDWRRQEDARRRRDEDLDQARRDERRDRSRQADYERSLLLDEEMRRRDLRDSRSYESHLEDRRRHEDDLRLAEDRLRCDDDRRLADTQGRQDPVPEEKQVPQPEKEPESPPSAGEEKKGGEKIPVLTKDDDAAAKSLSRLGILGLTGFLVLCGVFWVGRMLISAAENQDHGATPSTLQVKEDTETPSSIRLAGLSRVGSQKLLSLFKEHLELNFYDPLSIPFLGSVCEARFAEGDYGGVTVRIWSLSWNETLLSVTADVFTRKGNDMDRVRTMSDAVTRILVELSETAAVPWAESRGTPVLKEERVLQDDSFSGISVSFSRTGMNTATAIRIHLPQDGTAWGNLRRCVEFAAASDDVPVSPTTTSIETESHFGVVSADEVVSGP